MRSWRVGLAWLPIVIAGCGSAPPMVDRPVPAVVDAPVASAFETRQRERATTFTRQRRWGDAAIAWEILAVLRPDVADYRQRRDDARTQAEAEAADHLAHAAQAQKRGDLDLAMQHDLAAHALRPDSRAAADGLRAIERERVRRNQLGRYSRLTLSGRQGMDGEVAPPRIRPMRPAASASAANPPSAMASAPSTR